MAKKTIKKSNYYKKKPKIVKITQEQMLQLSEAVKQSNLDKELSDFILDLASGSHWLVTALERGEITIAKLRKMLFGSQTETYKNRKNKANNNTAAGKSCEISNQENKLKDGDNKKTKGHGRIGADAYSGADIVDVKLDNLNPGDDCPDTACEGRLYEMSDPGVLVRVTGGPMAKAIRYNLQKLRCNLCDVMYTAKKPQGIGEKKYDDSFVAMLMMNKFFMSIPMYRQENLQRYLGVPLPSSTQWELMASHEKTLATLYDAFIYDAAQAKGLSFDDTKARILQQIAENKVATSKKDRKACYTTGVVSAHDDHLSYLFLTNNQTAGKAVSAILKQREGKLPTPYLMCDALSANIPEDISSDLYILCYCLVHARRQFYELPDGYDDLADRVILSIGKVYDHEDQTKTWDAQQRLAYHQKHSQPIMLELKTYLEAQQNEFEPNSAPGRALNYIIKRWTELSQFLRHKHAPIDTNIVERALKLVIQVRKSSLFYKTFKSARIASYIQTALYSAAQNNINPYDYMRAILSHAKAVEDNPNQWLPWKYQTTLLTLEAGSGRQAENGVTGLP